jgi:hypothetical protein
MGLNADAHKSRLKAMRVSKIEPQRIREYDSLYTEHGHKAYPTWQLMKSASWYENNPTTVASCYAQLTDIKKALYWLEKAYKKRDGALARLYSDPQWDPLRGHPEFQDLLKRMNFPD